jgi:hypothetical protein
MGNEGLIWAAEDEARPLGGFEAATGLPLSVADELEASEPTGGGRARGWGVIAEPERRDPI